MSTELIQEWTTFLKEHHTSLDQEALLPKESQNELFEKFSTINNPLSKKNQRKNFRFYIILIREYLIHLKIKAQEFKELLEEQHQYRLDYRKQFDSHFKPILEETEEVAEKKSFSLFPELKPVFTQLHREIRKVEEEIQILKTQEITLLEEQKHRKEHHHIAEIACVTIALEKILPDHSLMPTRVVISQLIKDMENILHLRAEKPSATLLKKIGIESSPFATPEHHAFTTDIKLIAAARASGFNLTNAQTTLNAFKPLSLVHLQEEKQLNTQLGAVQTATTEAIKYRDDLAGKLGEFNTALNMVNKQVPGSYALITSLLKQNAAAITETISTPHVTPAITKLTELAGNVSLTPFSMTPKPSATESSAKKAELLEQAQQTQQSSLSYRPPNPFPTTPIKK